MANGNRNRRRGGNSSGGTAVARRPRQPQVQAHSTKDRAKERAAELVRNAERTVPRISEVRELAELFTLTLGYLMVQQGRREMSSLAEVLPQGKHLDQAIEELQRSAGRRVFVEVRRHKGDVQVVIVAKATEVDIAPMLTLEELRSLLINLQEKTQRDRKTSDVILIGWNQNRSLIGLLLSDMS